MLGDIYTGRVAVVQQNFPLQRKIHSRETNTRQCFHQGTPPTFSLQRVLWPFTVMCTVWQGQEGTSIFKDGSGENVLDGVVSGFFVAVSRENVGRTARLEWWGGPDFPVLLFTLSPIYNPELRG